MHSAFRWLRLSGVLSEPLFCCLIRILAGCTLSNSCATMVLLAPVSNYNKQFSLSELGEHVDDLPQVIRASTYEDLEVSAFYSAKGVVSFAHHLDLTYGKTKLHYCSFFLYC